MDRAPVEMGVHRVPGVHWGPAVSFLASRPSSQLGLAAPAARAPARRPTAASPPPRQDAAARTAGTIRNAPTGKAPYGLGSGPINPTIADGSCADVCDFRSGALNGQVGREADFRCGENERQQRNAINGPSICLKRSWCRSGRGPHDQLGLQDFVAWRPAAEHDLRCNAPFFGYHPIHCGERRVRALCVRNVVVADDRKVTWH